MDTVCVHEIRNEAAGILPKYILVIHPEMRVHEDATRFVSCAQRAGGLDPTSEISPTPFLIGTAIV
jgi:hypothetical protein